MKDLKVCQVAERDNEPSFHMTHDNNDTIESIAYGVRARLEENTGYERMVTDATIKVARAMGIPESEIERWTAQRLTVMNDSKESLREIKRIMGMLGGSNNPGENI